MHIAIVSITADPLTSLGGVDDGGQGVAIDALARHLALAGNAVTVYTQPVDADSPAQRTTIAGVRIVSVDAGGPTPTVVVAALRAQLGAMWQLARPDIVHAHSARSGEAALGAARELGIPVVQTLYDLGRVRRAPDGGAVFAGLPSQAELARAATRIIATSSTQVFNLLELGAHPTAIKFVPCGVDLERFMPVDSSAVRRPGPFRVVTLGRLATDAGVADVVEAIATLADVELTIGGGRWRAGELGADALALAELAQRHGAGQRVSVRGRVTRDEVPFFLQAADLVVCPAWFDSSGAVALEAMACGIPVIATAIGGQIDAVADGISGVHVPPRSPRQLAYAIDALRSDPARRERFARCGLERARVRFGWPRIAAETAQVYRSCIERPVAIGSPRSSARPR